MTTDVDPVIMDTRGNAAMIEREIESILATETGSTTDIETEAETRPRGEWTQRGLRLAALHHARVVALVVRLMGRLSHRMSQRKKKESEYRKPTAFHSAYIRLLILDI